MLSSNYLLGFRSAVSNQKMNGSSEQVHSLMVMDQKAGTGQVIWQVLFWVGRERGDVKVCEGRNY